MPPACATRYSSGWAPAGNCTLLAASRRAEENSTALPSGVKLAGTSSAVWNVRRVASPPVDGMTKTSKLP